MDYVALLYLQASHKQNNVNCPNFMSTHTLQFCLRTANVRRVVRVHLAVSVRARKLAQENQCIPDPAADNAPAQ
eukprot:1292145-Amphidinium_carterae.1